jgi:PilZ domain
MERRTKRFPLRLPMTVRWTTQSGISEAESESQDVSSGGIYFFLSEHIEAGSPVEIVMTLPAEDALESRTHLRCRGRVQRTEVTESNRIGVAAQIERYDFFTQTRMIARSWDEPSVTVGFERRN